jgi:hypothetical protein
MSQVVTNGLENTCYKAPREVLKCGPAWVGANWHEDIWINNWRRLTEFWVKILGFFVCISDLHTIKRRKDNWIGHALRRNCLLKRLYWSRDRRDEKMKKEMEVATGWHQGDEKIPEFQRECTRSHSVGNSLRERLSTCRTADWRANEWISVIRAGCSRPLWFDQPTNVWWTVQITNPEIYCIY